jgi:UDP-galactopyranose mutase
VYDYLIVGAGLFGAVFAREMTDHGYTCLVIDKRHHIGGNCYTEDVDGIQVHRYGAHIFHTNNKRIWDYVQRFAAWIPYRHRVTAWHGGRAYSFPINLRTLEELWGVKSEAEAKARLERERSPVMGDDLESTALAQVGRELYKVFIEGYTLKQWGRHPSRLPGSILSRIAIRLTKDDVYFSDEYQGIPRDGYTRMVERMLSGIDVRLGCDYLDSRAEWNRVARRVVYTGPLDALFSFDLGRLEYRSLRFVDERLDRDRFQDNAVVNYTEAAIPWTRIIEHKTFTGGTADFTLITREYPAAYDGLSEPYYPVPDERNTRLATEYLSRARHSGYLVGGRLGTYRYYDMHQVIAQALATAKQEIDECHLQ